jgi:hypothetical protein
MPRTMLSRFVMRTWLDFRSTILQCCGSGMFIPDSDFLIFVYPGSRTPDPKTATKERGEKNLMSYFFCSHKNLKIVNYINVELVEKKIWASLQRIIEIYTIKLSLSSQKYGCGIRDPEKTYSVSQIPDPGV